MLRPANPLFLAFAVIFLNTPMPRLRPPGSSRVNVCVTLVDVSPSLTLVPPTVNQYFVS